MPAPPPPGLSADARLRHELVALLRGRQAHVDARTVLADVPPEHLNRRPDGADHSLWELAWHLWFTQRDIVDFCRDPGYTAPPWPDAYWPTRPGDASGWQATVRAFHADADALAELARTADLHAELAWAPGYTVLREVLLAADHAAYHLGQIVALRRRLGLWPSADGARAPSTGWGDDAAAHTPGA